MERTSSHSSVEGAQSADQPPELVGDVWSQAGDKGDSGDTSVDGESLEVLSNLANTVQSVYETLQDGTLAEGYETGSVNRLRGDMAQAKGTLLKYGLHLTTVADRVNFLSDKLNVTSNLIKTKLQDEHIPFSDENGGETDEIWALEHAATAHSAFAQAAVDLAEMQKLASEIAESAYKATAAAERCKTRAEIVDERLDTAAGQTQSEVSGVKQQSETETERTEEDETKAGGDDETTDKQEGSDYVDNSVSNGNAENEDEKANEDSVNTEEQKEDAQENKPIPEVEAKQGETVDSEVTETNQAKNSEKEAKQNTTEDKSVKDSSDVARQTERIAQQQCDDTDVSTSGTDNTRDWPLITYPVAPEADSAEAGIACIVRAPEDALDKMQLQCDVIDSWDGTYKLANQEARVSNIVQLSSKGEPLHFDVSICVALPYRSPRGGMSREHTLVVMADQGNGEWAQLTSSETTFVDYKDIRFLEVRVNEIGSLTLLTVTKLKLDRHTITSRGGRITSSVDSRVCVVAPKRAFGAGAELSMQVCPVDSTVVAELKSRFAGCDSIISVSPVVTLHTTVLPDKPLSVALPCQQSGGSRSRPKSSVPKSDSSMGAATSKRPSTAWAISRSSRDDEDSETDEQVHILMKNEDSHWMHCNDIEFKVVRDSVWIDLDEFSSRIIVLRVSCVVTTGELLKMVANLEHQLSERAISMVVRQREDDMAAVHIECCPTNKVSRLLDTLAAEGYTYGPESKFSFYVRDGDRLEITFRGNLCFDDDDSFRFVYNSGVKTSRRDTFVKEVDRFAQHGLDYYRGHVQLMRLTGSTPGSGTQDGRGRQMLCEQPLTLPKPPMEPTVVVRAPVKVEETGPLTFGYFRELSEYIGDEWQQLAERLGIKRARIQSLMRSNPKVGSRPKNIEDMLLQWYKRCPKRHDKVADLYYSLCEVGREDLAVELRERNNEFLERADNIAEDDRLKRAVKAVIGSAHAWREWTSVARELGLTERQIADIERDNPGPDRRRDCCYQTLLAWQEIHGERATRKQLLRAMKRLRFKDVADKLSQIR